MKEAMIERWFPVNEVNIECSRERSFAYLPPLFILHVWWARRPLTACRVASILALTPYEDLSVEKRRELLYRMGFRGDPIDAFERRKRREKKAFNYPVAEKINPDSDYFRNKMKEFLGKEIVGADFMAGGGSIPFEMIRAGYDKVIAAEYNPVAYLILKGTLEYPVKYGEQLVKDVERYGKVLVERVREKLREFYPPYPDGQPTSYIWAKMFICPYCGAEIPSLRSLWLDKEKGYALYPEIVDKKVNLHVVKVEEIGKIKSGKKGEESLVRIIEGKFKGVEFETKGFEVNGKLVCPNGHVIESDQVCEIHKQSLVQKEKFYSNPIRLVAIVMENREYLEPTEEAIKAYERASEFVLRNWSELQQYIPTGKIPLGKATESVLRRGLTRWTELFTARQLLANIEVVKTIKEIHQEVFQDGLKRHSGDENKASEYAKAVITYLVLMFGKLLDYNSILSRWHTSRGVLANTFDSHTLAWTWDFGEFDLASTSSSLSWTYKNVLKSLKGLVKRIGNADAQVSVLLGDAEALLANSENKYDVIFIDPPYLDNVQYAENSDYFYVWFKLILKEVFPEAFSAPEVPKDQEAVANDIRHGNQKLANIFYERKMESIFRSIYKALRDEGVFLLWFAHKTGEAWIRTIRALLDSGFSIRMLWGVRSEMEHSIHVSGKAALRTSIIFICRKRSEEARGYIQDALKEMKRTLSEKLVELYDMELPGPDFLMGAMAHALKIASDYWPLKDPEGKMDKNEALNLLLNEVISEAINFHIRKVIPQISAVDPLTKFYIIARHWYKDTVPYDDARRLSLACLGASELRDPVEELVIKGGLGKIMSERADSVKDKVVRFLSPEERYKNEKLFKLEPKPLIDYIHKAVAMLEEGKRIEEVASILSEPGISICEIIRVLETVLPDQTGKGKNREKTHIRTLLYTICGENSHLLLSPPPRKEKESLEKFIG
ncbi:DUF1156 domain-containing protein [Candidatus Methanodesulfokora washburnensis]|uniref:DUF1156 domain-containing protein n=1 Tax=Candidatus Methanodesulfokora washburnensis TaxID=2478471 RepID=A0A3R9X166_9CREN|nr:DUF1156 domain-containing protein [Candidatus Methanodesulfokores washburnensis]RSN72764.1 DUF1156 domain-containing protein [Candidatus Methanodesulfokores washburnensis]